MYEFKSKKRWFTEKNRFFINCGENVGKEKTQLTVKQSIGFIISDRDRIRTYDRLLRRQMLYPAELRDLIFFFDKLSKLKKGDENQFIPLSGWQDSNLRPPAPKAGAITGLRYTPNKYFVQFNISNSASIMRPSRLNVGTR